MVNWQRVGSIVWKERRYVDTWSVNHLLAGVLLACAAAFAGLHLIIAAPVALALFIFWELFERIAGASEALPNQVLDIVVDVAGFALGWRLWTRELMDLNALVVIAAVFGALLAWGYYSKFRFSLAYD